MARTFTAAQLREIADYVDTVDEKEDSEENDIVGIDKWRLVGENDTVLGWIVLGEQVKALFEPVDFEVKAW